ncbi:MAG: bifunctional diaminohydroxyphosphoribosylaminopyrimidine deaminase/5-amino-6-(5-phosphoribosylamino)uracil reductase RibD [Aestuariivirga sp.]
MDLALRLGRRALGTTAENPNVGCVLVKNEALVGAGCTQPGGRPHAEAMALEMAGDAAENATAYVTLEPCAHHGRTPPCALALMKSGISRVTIAMDDPDPRVSGKGIEILRNAGIAVEIGDGAEEARRDLAGFLTRILKKRPYVTLKLGISSDFRIAAKPGVRSTITGEESGRRVHLLRAQSDAVLIGLSTALADDPELTCRLPGMEKRSPVRIVVDSRLSIPSHLKLVKNATDVPLWLLSTRKGPMGPGITVVDCLSGPNKWVDFADALKRLGERGINRLLVEGGSFVARSFLDLGLVDEVQLFEAPVTLGEGALEAVAGLDREQVLRDFDLREQEKLGGDVLSVYVKRG